MSRERDGRRESGGRGAGAGAQRWMDVADDLGERVGRTLGGLYQGVRGLADRTAKRGDDGAEGDDLAGGAESQAERAETFVKEAEQKIGAYTTMASYGLRRIAARAKEEYEDIVAEARSKRATKKEDAGPQ